MDVTLLAITASDERLWRAVSDGDASAFQTVVERYQGAVAGVAFSIIGEFTASQDVAQETFWTAWKSRTQLREPSRLGGWLCGIARNLANDWVRKQRVDSMDNDWRLREMPSRELDPAEQSISIEEKSLVWSSLEDLPEHYREVLVLFYRQGRAVAEVAAALDLSEDAVKQRLSRGREMTRKVARGWIAIGDRAQGILLGVGGMARGLVAFGGIAYGGLAVGGISLGLIGLGGLALGLLAVGGGAMGHTAIGGGAVGWDAAGGLAIGWDSACGGLAVAKHVAAGGLAVATDFAVGGQAHANSVNNPVAERAVAEESLQWMLAWYMRNQTMALVVIIGFSLAPVALAPFCYRRK